jgi:hypothetical protein
VPRTIQVLAASAALTLLTLGAQPVEGAAPPASWGTPAAAAPDPGPAARALAHGDDRVVPRAYSFLPGTASRPGVPRKLRVLVMRVYWKKAPSYPDTQQMKGLMKSTATWFKRTSRGRHLVSSAVTPWMAVAGGSANCGDLYGSTRRAVGAARSRGFSAKGFNRFMIVMPQCGTNSSGEMPGRVTWIREGTTYRDVLTHELGHNLGLDHANSLICHMGKQRITQGPKCASQEYGDLWDAMGISSRPYSVAVLQRLGWAGKLVTATSSGTWRLADAEASGSGIQGLRVKVSKRVSYWLEYHTTDEASEKQPGTFAVTGTPGLQIRLDTGRKSLQILDAAPGNPDGSLYFPDPDLANATLPPGSSFTTPQGVRITLVSQDAGGATVQVQRNKKASAPDAPTITRALRPEDSSLVTLSVKSGSDNGQVILGYVLQRSPGGDSTFVTDPGGTSSSLEVEDNHQGTGTWSVRAVNQVGTSAASAGVAEHVPAPVITSVTPGAGAQVQGPTFPVAVTASPDPVTGSPVTRVQVCSGASIYTCSTDTAAPFTFTMDVGGASSVELEVNASDADDNSVRVKVPVTVLAAPPSVRIDSPADGAAVTATEPFTVTATGTPSPFTGSPVIEVQFLAYDAAGNLVFNDWDESAPYAMDMQVPTAGTYRIEAEATDAAYLTATASIHVVAGDPPVSPAVRRAGGPTLTDVRG